MIDKNNQISENQVFDNENNKLNEGIMIIDLETKESKCGELYYPEEVINSLVRFAKELAKNNVQPYQ